MLFWKSKSSLEMSIYEVEQQQEGIFPFYTTLIVALGLGTCSLPGMRMGKQAECLAGINLCRALCLLCLSSSPSWSCSAFSTPHRKVRWFECVVKSSLTHWCQKHELITEGKCSGWWVFVGQERCIHEMKQPAPFLPLQMLQKAVAAPVLREDEQAFFSCCWLLVWSHLYGTLVIVSALDSVHTLSNFGICCLFDCGNIWNFNERIFFPKDSYFHVTSSVSMMKILIFVPNKILSGDWIWCEFLLFLQFFPKGTSY